MALDACHKELVGVGLGVLDEVGGCLLCRDSDERNTLVSWLEPDNLGTLNGTLLLLFTTVALTLSAFSLLLLLGSSRRRTQETEGSGEELARHTLNNSDDVPCELGLDFIGDPDSRLVTRHQNKIGHSLFLASVRLCVYSSWPSVLE